MGFAGFGIVMTAGPALADPTCQEVAVGSDTIQDIMNQYSVDLGTNELCSFNAVDPVSQSTTTNIEYVRGLNATQPATTCLSQRPNGSGAGQTGLRESINAGTGATPPLSPVMPVGCADVARSSSAPSAFATTGALTWIPFAEDAVAGAVGPAVGGVVQGIEGPITTVATNITQANLFTTADLTALYKNCLTVTEGGVTYWPFQAGVTQPPNTQQIDLYAPQAGSGTLKFWATETGFTSTAPPACVHQTVVQGTSMGAVVEEHNGIAMSTDPDGYGPFSIAQWLAQKNHTTGMPVDLDRRYGAVLQNIAGVAPLTAGGSMNTAFPFNREVFNVVEGCRVDSTAPNPITPAAACPAGSVDPTLVAMLAGSGGSLCQDALTILNYGFALLVNNTHEPNTCGQFDSTLRAIPAPV
jgi:hypothetical protein